MQNLCNFRIQVKEDDLVCMVCHSLLKKTHVFKLQVEYSMQLLGQQVPNPSNAKAVALQMTNIQIVSLSEQAYSCEKRHTVETEVELKIEDVTEQDDRSDNGETVTNDFESVELMSDCKQEYVSGNSAVRLDNDESIHSYRVPVIKNVTGNNSALLSKDNHGTKIDVVGYRNETKAQNTYARILSQETSNTNLVPKFTQESQKQNTYAIIIPQGRLCPVSKQNIIQESNVQNNYATILSEGTLHSVIEQKLTQNIQNTFEMPKDSYLKKLLDKECSVLEPKPSRATEPDPGVSSMDTEKNHVKIHSKGEVALNEIPSVYPDSRFTCEECGRIFDYQYKLLCHIQITHRMPTLHCGQCKRTFRRMHALNRHIESKHNNETRPVTKEKPGPVACDVCSQMIKSKRMLWFHKRRFHAEEEEKVENRYCVQCDKIFPTKTSYIHHLTSSRVHGASRYECDYCGKTFTEKGSIKSHIKHMHIKKKQYACGVCGKLFVKRYAMREHEKYKHFGMQKERKYVCNYCGKTFTDKTILQKHMLIHTGQKDFHCQLCPMRFTQKSTLTTHCKLKHKDIFQGNAKNKLNT